MKCKLFLLLYLVFSASYSFAQHKETLPVELNWKGIERWHADSLYIDVLNFEGARHAAGSNLPCFTYEIAMDPAYVYSAQINNARYISAAPEEVSFLSGLSFPHEPGLETNVSSYRGSRSLYITVSTIVMKDGELLKLKSFDLDIEKKKSGKKASQASTIHSYAAGSVLSKGRFVKVQIRENGIYKLTYDELRRKNIDPANVRVFGYGGAVLDDDFTKPKYDDLPEIAVYDTGNAVLFYAQGINKWTYDASKKMFTHKVNSYSNYGYYFVTSDNIGQKKRIGLKEQVVSDVYNDVTAFTDYRVHEKELHNLGDSGKEFYGERFDQGTSMYFTFNFPNVVSETPSILIRTEVAGVTLGENSTFTLKFNGASPKNLTMSNSGKYTYGVARSEKYTFTPSSDNFMISLDYSSGEKTAAGYLNFIEINAMRRLKMAGTAMIFHNKEHVAENSYNRYLLEDAGSNVQIWDINDPVNVKQINTAEVDGKKAFVDSAHSPKSYAAVNTAAAANIPSAVLLDEVPSQNIHGMAPVDMLIITHPIFVSAAQKLAQAHFNHNGLRVGVVTTEQVYNEFSSGTPDASAYRWVCKMFYDKPQNADDKLKYLLLFGKGSFDNRGLLIASGEKLTLTYQADNSLDGTASYVSDDYFGLLDDGEDGQVGMPKNKVDIGIGRFPVVSASEAMGVVDKTIAYMQNKTNGIWKNQLCFVGDDGSEDDGYTKLHMEQANRIADSISKQHPGYQINKILLDAYQQETTASGQRYPGAKNRFHNLIRTGVFYINYMGHANMGGWANEQILLTSEIAALKNKDFLPLFSAGTCEFSRFDKNGVSGGEAVVTNPLGGGIGCFSASRTVYPNPNEIIVTAFIKAVFSQTDGQYAAVGEAVAKAKNASLGSSIAANTASYVYFGDPAVKLNYPTRYKAVATEINGNPITSSAANDTLKAMSAAVIKGIISDSWGNKVDDFNGSIQVVVLDKEQVLKTLQNDGQQHAPMSFTDRPNTIFKGKTEVKNGGFEITFMLPRDIKYNYGTGRFNFYAWDHDNEKNYEAQGYFENFIVGGSSDDFIDENEGPDVYMYLNHAGFVSGGKVNETPVFTAHLYDQNGINTSGSSPGHDLMLSIDDKYWYELNDYYEAATGSYQRGTVSFQLPEIEEGMHTLRFRSWDLLNNSTTATLDFEVVKNLSPELFAVSCYPNPVNSVANIYVRHDREDEIIEMTVDIYDLSGRRIWTTTQAASKIITWDLTKDGGEKVPSGMYIYRVSIRTDDKITSSKANKIIVNR